MRRGYLNRRCAMRGTVSGRRLRVEPLERRNLLAVVVGTAAEFVAAIDDANTDATITEIEVLDGAGPFELDGPVVYTGGQPLTIDGNFVTIRPTSGAEGAFDLFTSTGEADLTLEEITFEDGDNGVFVDISATEKGKVVFVVLEDVLIQNCSAFGLLVRDAAYSDAGINVTMLDSHFTGNGTLSPGFDGVLIQESGAGNIDIYVDDSHMYDNGGNGFKVIEGGAGDINVSLNRSTIEGNGFLDDGDLGDGVVIEEAGEGSLFLTVFNTRIEGNARRGLRLVEAVTGDLHATLDNLKVADNGEEGVQLFEYGTGLVDAVFTNMQANGNGNEGIQLREWGDGQLTALFANIQANFNGIEGFKVAEHDDGDLIAEFIRCKAIGNLSDGAELSENGDGDLVVSVSSSRFIDNAQIGLWVYQESTGTGTLTLKNVKVRGNGWYDLKYEGVGID